MPPPETEVQDGLARAQVGHRGRVAAAEARGHRVGGQRVQLVRVVEARPEDRVAGSPAAGSSSLRLQLAARAARA